jgi:multidrug efflux pump subunit AcrA (membrane-fusion protein)
VPRRRLSPQRLAVLAALVALPALALVGFNALGHGRGPDVPTAVVTYGDFVEVVETRGDVRPFRSIVVTAPFQAGELQILTLAANGAAVKRGDVVANFEAVTLRRTLQDKESELRQAQAELDQATEQTKIDAEQDRTGTSKAQY